MPQGTCSFASPWQEGPVSRTDRKGQRHRGPLWIPPGSMGSACSLRGGAHLLSSLFLPFTMPPVAHRYKSNEEYVYVRGRGRGKYVCEECGIRCKKPSMLKKHIRTHTDVRPYVCKHCHFAFKTKGKRQSAGHCPACPPLGAPFWESQHRTRAQPSLAGFPSLQGTPGRAVGSSLGTGTPRLPLAPPSHLSVRSAWVHSCRGCVHPISLAFCMSSWLSPHYPC